MDVLRTAWRNVWRNPRRSGTTIAAMSLALYVLILYSGLLAGYLRDMEANIVELEVGDAQIAAPGYRKDPDLYTRIDATSDVVATLTDAGFRASPRLLAWGLVAAEQSSAGVQFRGIDVRADGSVSRVSEHIQAGAWLDPEVAKGVVIGRRLARMLDVELGSELVVITQSVDGSMAYELVNVRGILNSIGDATDMSGVFILAETLRSLVGITDEAHQIVVRRPEGSEPLAAAADLRELVPALDVRTWRELNPTMASMLDSSRQAMGIMYIVVYVAVAILILNAMLMATFERIREIGVLKALGVGPGQIFALMTSEAAFQTGIAVLIGLVFGVPTLLYLAANGFDVGMLSGVSVVGIAMPPVWYPVATASIYVAPVGSLLVISALAAGFPALKAARVDPVQAMRHR